VKNTVVTVVPVTGPLAAEERSAFQAHEATIEHGVRTFLEVGRALGAIRDGRLYRETHGTFEAYCRERWQMDRTYAHRTIDAARVCEMLPTGNTPANEAQVRPLTKIRTEDGDLDSKAILRVWKRAADLAPADDAGRKVITARVVAEAVKPVILRRRNAQLARDVSPLVPCSTDGAMAQDRVPPDVAAGSACAAPGRKINITSDQFAELHSHVAALAKMMITETIPPRVRGVIEDICQIVLD